MKKQLITMTLALVGLFAGLQVYAGDKDFTGTIVYNITYPDSKLDAQTMAMMPTTMKATVKGDWSKMDISMSMGSTVTIFDAATKSGTVLMDMMGQKFAVAVTPESIEEEVAEMGDIQVEETDETKEIAGYQCHKVNVTYTSKGKAYEQVAWFTEELGDGSMNASNPIFKDVKGVLLEFSMDESGMKMKMEAISVDKKKVSDKEFEVPEDYKKVTQQELENMFGGGY
jgi:hypothetical protein